jgi:hypothetical protein
LLLLAATFRRSSAVGPLAVGSGSVFLLGAPLVHLTHRHADRALASLVLRAALPLAGLGLSTLLGASDTSEWLPGVLIGVAGASATDASALAWDTWDSGRGSASLGGRPRQVAARYTIPWGASWP